MLCLSIYRWLHDITIIKTQNIPLMVFNTQRNRTYALINEIIVKAMYTITAALIEVMTNFTLLSKFRALDSYSRAFASFNADCLTSIPMRSTAAIPRLDESLPQWPQNLFLSKEFPH